MADPVSPFNRRQLNYTGGVQPPLGQINQATGRRHVPYLPDEALREAVNLAIQLERPLLLKGEPGCGKTRVAEAVAYELGLKYFEWFVKSTSEVRQGQYFYDAVQRLRDAQISGSRPDDAKLRQKVDDPSSYVTRREMWNAFQSGRPAVLLIDEIDKADIDFPNDLLLELDQGRFLVEETGEWVAAIHNPIVIVTSNDEKDLPDAFLRRCLFYYIDFPDEQRLKEIVLAHFPEEPAGAGDSPLARLAQAAVTRFKQLRDRMAADDEGASKKVSTSELLDWFRALRGHAVPPEQVLSEAGLPFPSVLLKNRNDYLRYVPHAQPAAGGA